MNELEAEGRNMYNTCWYFISKGISAIYMYHRWEVRGLRAATCSYIVVEIQYTI